MDFNTGLFRRQTKSWFTHQLSSIYTVTSIGFIFISGMLLNSNLMNSIKIHLKAYDWC